jgi:hypothetical protein
VHRSVLREVRDELGSEGLVVVDATTSLPRGADGNVEFFVRCCKGNREPIGDDALSALVETAHGVEIP